MAKKRLKRNFFHTFFVKHTILIHILVNQGLNSNWRLGFMKQFELKFEKLICIHSKLTRKSRRCTVNNEKLQKTKLFALQSPPSQIYFLLFLVKSTIQRILCRYNSINFQNGCNILPLCILLHSRTF